MRWRIAVAGAAVVATAATFWITLDAEFLAYPGWLAVQKADFILGPALTGLYWLHRRPESRFGWLLIGFGFVGGVYVLQSSSNPWLFGAGLVWENVIYLATLLLILTFPTGRLDGMAARLIMLAAALTAALPATVIVLVLPQTGAGGSISGCREACPENALAFASDPELALKLSDVFRGGAIAVAVATAALLIARLVRGTPPQRRALAIGTPIALAFLVAQILFLALTFLAPDSTTLQTDVRWAFVGARAALWYGFLFALVAAELFAARAVERLVRQSLRRPSEQELETLLREPLGDPELQLVFARAGVLQTDEPGAGRDVTVVAHAGRPAVALVHDAQLNDDPELLQAAGAVALLAADNAELDTAWHDALSELRQSRVRIVRARDTERRRLERNLHDGVQQRLVAVSVELGLAGELAGPESPLRGRLAGIGESVAQALEELREVSHGLYPPVLGEFGLVSALGDVRVPTGSTLEIRASGVGRHSPELESAIYHCCLEAIQNATKHSAGAGVRISVTLREDAAELAFEVADDGPGFDLAAAGPGTGLQNMRDRVGGIDGELEIVTAPGYGTAVTGSVPLHA
ncbi:MAG TPA: histidine kinase [Solirubrobacter sp.]|nr:histidine kinase [Solirubrobacter sp.]